MYEVYLSKSLAGLVSATQAIESYRKTNIKDIKNTAAYHVQQSLEYITKYLIYNCNAYNNGRTEKEVPQIYSHNLNTLILQYCDTYNIEVPVEIREKAILYTSWEAESRYSLGFSVRIDTIQIAIGNTSRWLISIEPKYQKKISEINKRLNLSI